MNCPEDIQELLALSAAGLLEPDEERRVRRHIGECPDCASHLDALAAVSMELSALPAPMAPPELVARTQARLAAAMALEADRRQGLLLGGMAVLIAWTMAGAAGYIYQAVMGGSMAAWLAWYTVPAAVGAAVTAGVVRCLERKMV